MCYAVGFNGRAEDTRALTGTRWTDKGFCTKITQRMGCLSSGLEVLSTEIEAVG